MGDYAGRLNSRKRATRRAKATRIKASSHLVNFLRSASSVGDSSPIRCGRKGQRLVVDSGGKNYIEQSLEVLYQRTNDDRRENLCSRLHIQTRPGDREQKRQCAAGGAVSPAAGRGWSFPRIPPDVRPILRLGEQTVAKVAFARTAVDRQTLPDPFGLLTATTGSKNPLRSVGCFLSDSIGFSPFGIVLQLIKFALLLRLQLDQRTNLSLVRWSLNVCNRRQIPKATNSGFIGLKDV